jgi:hypothetical protein
MINFLCVDKNNENIRIPVVFKPVIKDKIYEDPKKRKSSFTKNESTREIVGKLIIEQNLEVSHIVGDS